MTRRKKIIITISLIVVLIIIGLFINYFVTDRTIDDIKLAQYKMSVKASWKKERTKEYTVTIQKEGEKEVREYKTEKNSIDLPVNEIPATYHVAVKSAPNLKVWQIFPKKGKADIKTEKIEQKIIDKKKSYILI